ncbi:response regulator [Lyngbya confervoides]|uniref:Response regulator n=1 Tax=Lyngbya confervoides BDU141951 TaxID=1574623 RepID=A0ABD4T141_9CYAN|nr:response regulator [Lyngbya confervoides]MCM1982249.1 response regulator [Lyngbya confervoides BDU141951]
MCAPSLCLGVFDRRLSYSWLFASIWWIQRLRRGTAIAWRITTTSLGQGWSKLAWGWGQAHSVTPGDEDRQSHASPAAVVGYFGAVQRILIIDDAPDNRAVLRYLLESLGFQVIEAENGEQGLSQAQTQPNLVITDLDMPVLDGYGFLAALRAQPALRSLTVIVCSAALSAGERQKILAAGANDLLPKPVSESDLLHILRQYLPIRWRYASDSEESR